jgi:hypothetical protein
MALTKIKVGQISSDVVLEHVSKTSTFTMTAADLDGTNHLIISNDTTGAAYTVTLPTPADWTGKFVTCLHKTGGSNGLTFEQYGGSDIMISGTAAATTYYTVFSDGTSVIFMGNNVTAGGAPP